MNKIAFIGAAFLMVGCMFSHGRTAHTGHLFVTMTDRETGRPITNATVTVRTQTEFNPARTLESYFTKTSAHADTNGIAHVEFQFYTSRFDWWVDAPSHYCGMWGFGYGDERFGSIVEKSDYFNIDTNTVQGLAMYNELADLHRSNDYLGIASKFSPKSVTYTNNVVCRSVSLSPKHNPRPMYAYGGSTEVSLPRKQPVVVVTNGLEVTRYNSVDFDLKKCLVVLQDPDYFSETGEVPDFRIERFRVLTNGVVTTYGWLDFAPGCGAYITTVPGSGQFPVVYEADPNANFLSRIPYEYSSVSGKVVYASHPVGKGECLIMKTRVMTNEVGEVTSCNYSKIYGPMWVHKKMMFASAMFNPTPNDPNLEFDLDGNLSDHGEKCHRP